jgi:CPA2 family monovalent cation:H+ antiporter-2
MILAATRDAARLFLDLGTVTIVLAVGTRLAARTGFSSIPLYLVAGIVLGALAPPTLDDALVATLSEVGIVLLLFTLGLEYSAGAPPPKTTSTPGGEADNDGGCGR